MTDKKPRNTLSHIDYHKVCVFLGTLAVNNVIDAALPEIVEFVRNATSVVITPRQLLKMLAELNYGYQDGTPEFIVRQQQRDLARLSEALDAFGRQLDRINGDVTRLKQDVTRLKQREESVPATRPPIDPDPF